MTSIKFRALTHDDHKLFFEALGEHGKDFQNIQQYMAQKCGKSNNKSTDQNKSTDTQEKRDQDKKDDDKKREQIRNFYNKLYGKLSQLIGKLDDRVERGHQELYLLINYGEIWKKHGFKFNNKTKKLLEELVHQGYSTLRFKNKNVRLRTPPCKALKKINKIGIDEKVKVVTSRELPKDVIVEFLPATNRDWLKVQSMSQNPRVRARLSIQKRVSNILEFLENKWNISQDKLNRTVDAWLKVPPSNQSLEDLQQNQSLFNYNSLNGSFNNNNNSNHPTNRSELQNNGTTPPADAQIQAAPNVDSHPRLRLKPSATHELKEVNITRVVPDNHLDLSLNAYISRLGECTSKTSESSTSAIKSNSVVKDAPHNNMHSSRNAPAEGMVFSENPEHSQGAMSSSSRLPISLTTPDCSILLERSYTSDQPSIAQARKHLNMLQSIAGSFEGCENSRTTCEDTQDRLTSLLVNSEISRTSGFGGRVVSFAGVEFSRAHNSLINNNIPALIDEDAAIDPALAAVSSQDRPTDDVAMQIVSSQHNLDSSQNSRSVDFHIPEDMRLGDWLGRVAGQGGVDDANDAFPVEQKHETSDDTENIVENSIIINEEEVDDCPKIKVEPINGNLLKPQNHMIEMKRLAEGWTRQDESSVTIGELYLAFKCPEKIVLEYEFEQFTYNNNYSNNNVAQQTAENCTDPSANGKTIDPSANSTTIVPENPSNNILIFKLLTAASLSLAHIERQRQEQQQKLSDPPGGGGGGGGKLKRRKGPNNDKNQGQGQAMTLHDIEATNQRVEEALKQLQPTRLSVFRRAR